jgi:AraC-like DNA-binding protein
MMHAHDVLEIFIFISGKGSYVVEGNTYSLLPYDILIMRSTEAHKLNISPEEPYERVTIHFSPTLLRKFDNYEHILEPFFHHPLGRLNQYHPSDFSSEHWLSCLNAIETYANANVSIDLFILSNLFALLAELCNAFHNRTDKDIFENSNNVSIEMIDYINKNLYNQISLKEVSTHFFLSQSQTNRIFKKATGSSVWEYILLKRLLVAKQLIQNGETPLKAHNSCGFTDYSSFYRKYKLLFGCSPKDDVNIYRNRPSS